VLGLAGFANRGRVTSANRAAAIPLYGLWMTRLLAIASSCCKDLSARGDLPTWAARTYYMVANAREFFAAIGNEDRRAVAEGFLGQLPVSVPRCRLPVFSHVAQRLRFLQILILGLRRAVGICSNCLSAPAQLPSWT